MSNLYTQNITERNVNVYSISSMPLKFHVFPQRHTNEIIILMSFSMLEMKHIKAQFVSFELAFL